MITYEGEQAIKQKKRLKIKSILTEYRRTPTLKERIEEVGWKKKEKEFITRKPKEERIQKENSIVPKERSEEIREKQRVRIQTLLAESKKPQTATDIIREKELKEKEKEFINRKKNERIQKARAALKRIGERTIKAGVGMRGTLTAIKIGQETQKIKYKREMARRKALRYVAGQRPIGSILGVGSGFYAQKQPPQQRWL